MSLLTSTLYIKFEVTPTDQHHSGGRDILQDTDLLSHNSHTWKPSSLSSVHCTVHCQVPAVPPSTVSSCWTSLYIYRHQELSCFPPGRMQGGCHYSGQWERPPVSWFSTKIWHCQSDNDNWPVTLPSSPPALQPTDRSNLDSALKALRLYFFQFKYK